MSDKELRQDNEPEAETTQQQRTGSRCPVCGKPAVVAHEPFCSARCKDVDLNRWFTGAYAIPGSPVTEEEPD